MAQADSIRCLACKALLGNWGVMGPSDGVGLAGDAGISQVLGRHQQLSKLLPELMREPAQYDKQKEHKQFTQYAIQLLAKMYL